MRARADYPTSPQYRRAIDRPSTKHGIAAREARDHRPSRQASPGQVPSKLAAAHSVELAVIEAAILLARDAHARIVQLDLLMRERPDLFDCKWVPGVGLQLGLFIRRGEAVAARRRGK